MIHNVNTGTAGAEIVGHSVERKIAAADEKAGLTLGRPMSDGKTVTINYGADLPLAQGVTFQVRE